ncbi:MAG: hypothetical protein DMG36_02335 [Acidobacteria bacterium]|nr:MAG: hypothetical protein DMG36_02335 [Acidobacteriota bacterium]
MKPHVLRDSWKRRWAWVLLVGSLVLPVFVLLEMRPGLLAGGIADVGGLVVNQYREMKYAYDRHVDVHGHWIGLAMVLIVMGIGLDGVRFDEQLKMLLAAGLLLGSLPFPLGVLLQTMSQGPGPRVLAVTGSALVIVSLAAMSLGFARGRTSV